MSVKYVELSIPPMLDVSAEELLAIPDEERQSIILNALTGTRYRLFLLSVGLLKYARHDESCTDDDDSCTCGFSELQEVAVEIAESMVDRLGLKDVTVN